MIVSPPVQRSIAEIESYAHRLHRADPGCTEVIPVSPEEAFALQEWWLASKHLTSLNCFRMEDVNIMGHQIKIL